MKKIILFITLLCQFVTPQVKEEMRAVKLTNVDSNVLFSDTGIAEAMDYLASIGINAVLPVVLNAGYTQYPSDVMVSYFGSGYKIDPDFAGRDPLQTVITEAHRVGIEVYPWFEYGFASYYSGGTAPFGGHILDSYPDWALRSKDGSICTKNGFDWMSGVNPDVQNFIISLVAEVCENYDVDGIEFSDRIPALPPEGGYDSVTVAIYKTEHLGAEPPSDRYDTNWKRWRADKLNQFYQKVRDTVKSYSTDLVVASSPSIYPWAYDNYLQDSKTWVNSGIVDHFIPQLYRYNISDYISELDNAISNTNTNKREIIFAGILMNVGSYIVTPDLLLDFLEQNRLKGVNGEAYFFYEGLRKNNNQLGDTLKATYYSENAIVPLRGGNNWRPAAYVVNEDSSYVSTSGSWEPLGMDGFRGTVFWTDDSGEAAIDYNFNVMNEAYYDVYIYMTPNTIWTDSAAYTLFSDSGSENVYVDQSVLNKKRWQKIGLVYLTPGYQKVVSLDNSKVESGTHLVTDAVMLMINRKLSPDVVVGIDERDKPDTRPESYGLEQNYPNPFNPETTINFSLPEASTVSIKVYDILGREVAVLMQGTHTAGTHKAVWNAADLSSGIYFYRLETRSYSETKKMMLLK